MNIIGIQWGDNSTACLISDDKIEAATAEERYTKIKNDMSYPYQSLEFCLSKIPKNQKLDYVALASKEFDYLTTLTHFYSLSIKEMIDIQNDYYHKIFYENKKLDKFKFFQDYTNKNQYPRAYWRDVSKKKIKTFSNDIKKIISQNLNINKNKIINIEHHLCHATYGYLTSPFNNKRCLVFTIDGAGDRGINATLSVGENGNLKKIYETKNCIIGRIYSHVTLLLGMRRLEHEYKIMGLAPYAEDKISDELYKIFDEILYLDIFKFKFNKKPKDSYFYFQKKLQGYRFDHICAAMQKWVETMIVLWVKNSVKKFKISNIVFSGGVAMNAKAMGSVMKLSEVKKLWVPGASQDDSICLGAAFNLNNQLNKKSKFYNLNSLYFGHNADEDEANFIASLDKSKFNIENKSYKKIAKHLSKGLIIGRCVGKMEFGPRSLGNRAILADPSNPKIKEKINRAIKNRDFWMPFAPTVIKKCAKKYLHLTEKFMSPHMSTTYSIKKNNYDIFLAAAHPADKTARAQILTKEDNLDYYNIINEFFNLTNIGLILNTSFNLHGYPVVRDLNDALYVFKKSELDILLTKNYIIKKNAFHK